MRGEIGRRTVLAGLTAVGAGQVLGQSLPSDPDVVVIGAGAAGMSAARTLLKQGLTCVVVEAAPRFGGRSWTESTTFGQPVDHGASWISGATANPFARMAREGGFTLVDHSDAGTDLFDLDGKRASAADEEAYWRAWAAMERAMARAGRSGEDVAASTVAPKVPWSATVQSWMGAMDYGVDLDQVSTGVLNAGGIRFIPELPAWKQQAAADIPMGLLTKVPLLFDGARLGLGENNWVTYRVPEDKPGEACFFIAWPTGHDYVFGNIGGRFGWELARARQAATVDYALEQLVRLVGSDARKHFVRGFATDWALNPLTHGAYGAVRPGSTDARENLAQPLADRLFFAGEATSTSVPALVNGAYLTGHHTAKSMAKILK